jgi:hypothetical protein
MARETFGRFMRQMGCKSDKISAAVIGEHITDVEKSWGNIRQAALIEKARATGYAIGTLPAAREAFTTVTGLKPAWPDDQD